MVNGDVSFITVWLTRLLHLAWIHPAGASKGGLSLVSGRCMVVHGYLAEKMCFKAHL